VRLLLLLLIVASNLSAYADSTPINLTLPKLSPTPKQSAAPDSNGISVMPDLYSLMPSTSVFTNQNQADAFYNAFKAFCIQSGFQDSYNAVRSNMNYLGYRDEEAVTSYLDDHTFISKTQLFVVVGLLNVVGSKSIGTSFKNPYFPSIRHSITIGVDNSRVGLIEMSF